MGWNDNIDQDDEDFKDYLESLLDKLDDPAKGITKLVIDKGEDALSPKQRFYYERDVADVYFVDHCKICATPILWGEMEATVYNGGTCPLCEHRMSKD